MFALGLVISSICGYLLGAAPIGLLLGLSKGVDVGAIGSGKTGATNVQRSLGTRAAIIVLLGDLAKGALAVILARVLTSNLGLDAAAVDICVCLAGFLAVVGHNWSVIIKLMRGRWTGGRGVATGAGILFLINPPLSTVVALGALVVMAATIALTRYVSLGSILGSALGGATMLAISLASRQALAYGLAGLGIGAFLIIRHADNIQRLRRGVERKLGQREAPPATP